MSPETKKNIAYSDFLSVRKFINDYAAGILVFIPIVGNISAKYVEAFAYEVGFLKEVHGDLWILVNLFSGLAAAYYVMHLFRDKQKTAEEAQDRAAFIHDLMLALPSGVFYRDAKNTYLYVNNEGCDIFGLTEKDILGKNYHDVFSADVIDDFFNNDLRALQSKHVISDQVIFKKNGENKNYTVRKTPRYDDNGDYVGMLTVVIDSDDLHKLSSTDFLTGLGNRRQFEEELENVIRKAERRKNKESLHEDVALIMIDVNKFKPINDTYGHATGDEALKEIARIISVHIRKTDTAARIGGDEFAIIASDIQNIENAKHLAEKIIAEIATTRLLTPQGDIPLCTVSIGICVFPNGLGESEFFPEVLKTTYNRADEAMYEAKMMSRKDGVIGGVIAIYNK